MARLVGLMPDQPDAFCFADEGGHGLYSGLAENRRKRAGDSFNIST
jgi:hypothetical protein